MWRLFTAQSSYRKGARILALIWTLLILFLCFIPANEIPNINVPFADKWVHFILFGVFSFLWLCALWEEKFQLLLFIFFISVLFGWLVEELQGLLSFLGRSKDYMDMAADSFGGFLGALLYYVLSAISKMHTPK